MLLWQGYPNLGLDDRSQFQLLESVPGGLEGLRGFIAGLQEGGVRVLLPYLPWDQGTSGQGDDIATLISQVKGQLEEFKEVDRKQMEYCSKRDILAYSYKSRWRN